MADPDGMQEREPASTDGPRCGGGRSPRPLTRSLVLWSGGLDSTYTLLRLLLESDDRVFSHHVSLVGDGDGASTRRSRAEAAAIERMRQALAARGRAFRHTHSCVQMPCAASGADAPLLAFMAGRAALALGFTAFDRILVGVNADRDPGWHPDSAACALRRARMSRAIRAAYGCDEAPHIYLWEPRPSRAVMLTYLGPDLAGHTVSCLRPEIGDGDAITACGACARCRDGGERAVPAAAHGDALSPDRGAAGRTRPLFRHLVESQSRTPAPPDAAAASDPPAP